MSTFDEQPAIYETIYGNAALVDTNLTDRAAYDLDAAEWVPIEMVTQKRIRDAEEIDEPPCLPDWLENRERGFNFIDSFI